MINASGIVIGGGGKVVLDTVFPDQGLTTVKAGGKETDPFAGNWKVKAIATCADPPSGLEWNELPSLDNSTSPKSEPVGCSTGKIMLGTGFDIVGGQGEAGAYSVIPEVDATGRADEVVVNVVETDPLATDWQVNAISICADPIYLEQVVYADATATSPGSLGATVYCPSGSVATGTGYDVPQAVGEMIVNSVDPGGTVTPAAPTDRTAITAYEEDGTLSTYTPRAYAICANR